MAQILHGHDAVLVTQPTMSKHEGQGTMLISQTIQSSGQIAPTGCTAGSPISIPISLLSRGEATPL